MSPQRGVRPLTIGVVLDRLREDFADLTISKIRFLEAEGLVTPARTPAGYRTYADSDVERLRYILRAQRDWFWPLKVIREVLDGIDRGLEVPTPGAGERPAAPPVTEDPNLPSVAALRGTGAKVLRLTLAELAEATGAELATLRTLESFGLLVQDGTGHFGAADLAVARAAAALAGHGMEARHLRTFKTAADREIGLVEQVLAGERKGSSGRVDRKAEILRQCLALHSALVRAGLDRN